ncbi:MAG: hypothetical protein HN380_04095 [Victivallales bacterium]|nr:hypothetical protein [Victivallales bacterium]
MLRRLAFVCSLVLAVTALSQTKLTVIADIENANPRLAITSYSGPAGMRTLLTNVLKRSDWFNLATTAAKAHYRVDARYTAGTPASLQLRVAPRKGRGFILTQPAAPGLPAEDVVYRAVDAMIKKLFGVPGPCSAPIAFAMGAPGNLKEVFTCRFDGSNMQRLTNNNSISTEPSWGPGNQRLVYTAYSGNATSVVMVDMLRKRQRRLSRFRGLNAGADLSPNGQWAALSLSRDQRIDLYLLVVASGKIKRLTQDSHVESSPCWSPSGSEICYVSDRAGKPRLCIVSANGGKGRLLDTGSRAETVSPDWSPVSNKICFSRRMGGQYAIGVLDMKTRKSKILTRVAGDWESPSWSPDGRHIVCSRRLGANSSLYMVDSHQGTFMPITRGGDHSLPSWGHSR